MLLGTGDSNYFETVKHNTPKTLLAIKTWHMNTAEKLFMGWRKHYYLHKSGFNNIFHYMLTIYIFFMVIMWLQTKSTVWLTQSCAEMNSLKPASNPTLIVSLKWWKMSIIIDCHEICGISTESDVSEGLGWNAGHITGCSVYKWPHHTEWDEI